jgi:hypothetical protein
LGSDWIVEALVSIIDEFIITVGRWWKLWKTEPGWRKWKLGMPLKGISCSLPFPLTLPASRLP